MGRRRVWLTCNVVVRCPLCIEAPPRRVSPASGRDGLVFASLTCSPSGVSPQRWETGGRERRFGVRFAHSFTFWRLTPAVGDGRAGETVWCSVRSLVLPLPSHPSGGRRAGGRDGLVFGSLTRSSSGVSAQRWETGGRERRFGVRFAHLFIFCRLSPAGRDASAASREGAALHLASSRWCVVGLLKAQSSEARLRSHNPSV